MIYSSDFQYSNLEEQSSPNFVQTVKEKMLSDFSTFISQGIKFEELVSDNNVGWTPKEKTLRLRAYVYDEETMNNVFFKMKLLFNQLEEGSSKNILRDIIKEISK